MRQTQIKGKIKKHLQSHGLQKTCVMKKITIMMNLPLLIIVLSMICIQLLLFIIYLTEKPVKPWNSEESRHDFTQRQ